MAKEKRFNIAYSQSSFSGGTTLVLVDKETGVNYLFHQNGNAGGMTPLLDRDGNPVITTVLPEED
jgi:hypothetical protein